MASTLSVGQHGVVAESRSSRSTTRMRPYLAAGVAMVGASLIAVNPVAPTIATDIQERAVRLTGSVANSIGDVTTNIATTLPGSLDMGDLSAAATSIPPAVNPLYEWLNVLSTSGSNLESIAGSWFNDPFPVLHQVVSNQIGYADTIVSSLQQAGQAQWDFLTGTTANSLVPLAQQMISDFTSGHISDAASTLNVIISDLIVAPGLDLLPVFSIPTDITGNLNDATNALFNLADGGKVLLTVLGALSPLFGTISAAGDQGQLVVDAWDAGQPVTALVDAINIPAVATNAFLNGYDPTGAIGLFSPVGPSGIGGLLADFVNAIPQAIAQAIAPSASGTAAAALASVDPVSFTAGLAGAFDPSALSMAFDPAAVTDIGSVLAADLVPNLSTMALDLLSLF